jgi:hypothetical protein
MSLFESIIITYISLISSHVAPFRLTHVIVTGVSPKTPKTFTARQEQVNLGNRVLCQKQAQPQPWSRIKTFDEFLEDKQYGFYCSAKTG